MSQSTNQLIDQPLHRLQNRWADGFGGRTDLDRAADEASPFEHLEQVLKKICLLLRLLVEGLLLQANALRHGAAEVHDGVPRVPAFQGLIAPGQPGDTREKGHRGELKRGSSSGGRAGWLVTGVSRCP